MNARNGLTAQRQMVDRLRDPARYPHAVSEVAVVETHISFVLLTGTFAYKIKKAVNLGFVDYTDPARRHFCCEEELRLNRRLAPQLYLDVVPICGSWSDPRWTGSEVIDHAVKMAEFAQTDLLDQVLARGRLTPCHVDALAAAVAAFHGGVPSAAPTQTYGSPETVWAQMAALLSRLQALVVTADRSCLGALDDWCRAENARLQAAFAGRQATGFVRECHGDLHLGNIVLRDDAPVVFDCIEFDPELRWIDIVADLAFLVMDLSERGRPDFAWRVVNAWLEQLGDYAGLEVLRFYWVYRALVRAMVAGLRCADNTLAPSRRQAAEAAARRYLAHAQACTAPAARALIITHGLAGSGKSTVARDMAERLGALRLRSDVERKRLHGLTPLARSGSGLDSGLYGKDTTRATYERLAGLAATVLAAGYPVIIDATCLRRWQRERFRALARTLDVPFLILDCQAPTAVLEQRVAAREVCGRDASEATLAVLAAQRRTAEPLDAGEQDAAIPVDTTRAEADATLARLRRLWRGR